MMLTGFDPQQFQDGEGMQQAIVRLLNLVEELKQEQETATPTRELCAMHGCFS